MKYLAALTALALAGCAAAPQPRTALYRDVSGQARVDRDLHMDMARCDYEISSMAATRPERTGPQHFGEFAGALNNLSYITANSFNGQAMYQKCMAARGWALVGYEPALPPDMPREASAATPADVPANGAPTALSR